jgi:hypothetical protein
LNSEESSFLQKEGENAVTLKIDEEFMSLIPHLSDDEFNQLEANLIADGCREPIVVWSGFILDGHNRFRICNEHDIPYDTVVKDLPDRDSAIEWINRNQFGRRNLTAGNRSILALRLEHIIQKKAKSNQIKAGGAVPQKSAEAVETREELAKIAGVSHDTIDKVKKIVADGTPEQVERIKKGDKGNSVSAVYNEVKNKAKKVEAQTADADSKPGEPPKSLSSIKMPWNNYETLKSDPEGDALAKRIVQGIGDKSATTELNLDNLISMITGINEDYRGSINETLKSAEKILSDEKNREKVKKILENIFETIRNVEKEYAL